MQVGGSDDTQAQVTRSYPGGSIPNARGAAKSSESLALKGKVKVRVRKLTFLK